MSKQTKKAFTLVELIVVITILAILGTIAFISLQGYSKNARDSVRISDISNIDKMLGVILTKTGKVPIPDDKVDITASGTLFMYQGDAGERVLDKIGVFNGGKDPLDEDYYTYSTNVNQTKYQLLGFLENGLEISLNNVLENTYSASDLINREIITRGDELGIVLDDITSQPIQNKGINIDLIKTNNQYKVYMSSDEEYSGSGTSLISSVGGGGLVLYWNFDEIVGSGILDLSKNGVIGTLTGTVINVPGKLGKGIYINGTGSSVHTNSIPGLGDSQGSPHTISAWLKLDSIDSCEGNLCRQWPLLLGSKGPGSHHWLVGGKDGPFQFGIWNGPQKAPKLLAGGWQYVTIVYDGLKLKSYVNGVEYKNNSIERNNTEMNIKNAELTLGFNIESGYKGAIDELRIYNRALSSSDVSLLYSISK